MHKRSLHMYVAASVAVAARSSLAAVDTSSTAVHAQTAADCDYWSPDRFMICRKLRHSTTDSLFSVTLWAVTL